MSPLSTKSKDGVKISYTKEGRKGPNLILIHGWCCDSKYWRKTTPSLSTEYQVYLIDLAGHGKSGTNRTNWTIPNYGEDVKALADQEKLSEATLVGHSMGGDVALAAAQLLGGRIRGVVLVDTYHSLTVSSEEQISKIMAPMKENFVEGAKKFVYGMFPVGADPGLAESIAEDMSSQEKSIAIPSAEATLRYDEGAAFTRLSVPVRCINCDMESSDYESARKSLRDFDATTMTNVGHFIMLEKPDEFNRVLRDTLAGLKLTSVHAYT